MGGRGYVSLEDMIFGHAWGICILPSSCFNLQIRSSKKKVQLLQIRTVQKKREEEKMLSWINEILLWGVDLGALVDFVDIRGFGFTTCA